MPKVVITWTRDDASKDWLLSDRKTIEKGFFTPEEASILAASKDAHSTLPGYVTSSVNFLDDYNYNFTIEFDTQQSAENAYNLLANPPVDSIFYLLKNLMIRKREQLGLNYEHKIELL
jgi:hypothetical protein